MISWIVDGETLATLSNTTAGPHYPQIPARVTIGIWCPACYRINPGIVGTAVADNLDTYIATIHTIDIVNYNPATRYSYRDMSGTSSSVIIQRDSGSPSGITVGDIAGIVVGALVGLIVVFGALFWLRRRKTKRRGGVYDPGTDSEIASPPISGDKYATTGDTFDTRRVQYPPDVDPNVEAPSGNLDRHSPMRSEIQHSESQGSESRPSGRLGRPPGPISGGRLGPNTERSFTGHPGK
jgi:hypothetical protein